MRKFILVLAALAALFVTPAQAAVSVIGGGSGNASYTNSNFNISSNATPSFGTLSTNSSTNAIIVTANVKLTADIGLANGAGAQLVVEQGGGITNWFGTAGLDALVVSSAATNQITGYVKPGGKFWFTNYSVGTGTATIQQVYRVELSGGVGGGGGGGTNYAFSANQFGITLLTNVTVKAGALVTNIQIKNYEMTGRGTNNGVITFPLLTTNTVLALNASGEVVSTTISGGSGTNYAFAPSQFNITAATNVTIKPGALVTNMGIVGGEMTTRFTNTGTVIFPLLTTNTVLALNSSGEVVSTTVSGSGSVVNVTASTGVGPALNTNGSTYTVYPKFNPAKTILVAEGDSITASTTPTNWFSLLTLGSPPGWTGFALATNAATAGDTLTGITNEWATEIAPLSPGTGTNAVLFVWIGANLSIGVTPTATFIQTYSNYIVRAQASNFTVCVFTLTTHTNELTDDYATTRFLINDWIRKSGVPDYVVDTQAMFPNCYNTNDFPDGIHLTQSAQGKLAREVDYVLRSGPRNGGYYARQVNLEHFGTNSVLRNVLGTNVFSVDDAGNAYFVGGLNLTNLTNYGVSYFPNLSTQKVASINASGFLSTTVVSLTGDVTGILPIANINTNALSEPHGITLDGGNAAITTGAKSLYVVSKNLSIYGWYIVAAPASSSVVLDVWVASGAVPTVANTITASAKPTLTSGTYAVNLAPSTWTTNLSVGDVIRYNVDSLTTATNVTLILVTRSR